MALFEKNGENSRESVSAHHITPAIKYLNIVIPAKAGIQEGTGCRIKSGMTELDYLVARLIRMGQRKEVFDKFHVTLETVPCVFLCMHRHYGYGSIQNSLIQLKTR